MDTLNESGALAHALQMIPLSRLLGNRLPGSRQRPPSGSGRQRGAPRQGLGRSRASGGKLIHWIFCWTTFHFTTKSHLLVITAGLPMRTEITPSQTSGHLGCDLVMAVNKHPILPQ
jgi:hypothetical protein